MTPTGYFEDKSSLGTSRGKSPPAPTVCKTSKGTVFVKNDCLRCLYTNIDGLNASKSAELGIAIGTEKPHVILLTETKLTSEVLTSQFLDCGSYSVFRRDRHSGRGGGVIILVRSDIWAEEVSHEKWENIEAIACRVKVGQRSLMLACIYRPPSASEETNRQVERAVLKMCDLAGDQILLCGDFNYKGIDWKNEMVAGADTSDEAKFYETCQDGFLVQHICDFTRSRGSDTPSLLDLVLSHSPLEVDDLKYLAPVGKSDHCVIVFKFLVERMEGENIQINKRNYLKADYAKARQLFSGIDWERELYGKDVDEAWDTFLNHYHEVVRVTVPFYPEGRGKAGKKWMNNHILGLIRKKEEMWKIYRKRKSQRSFSRYKRARNKVTSEIRKAKYNFEHRLAKEVRDNPKSFFAYARSQTTIREEVKTVRRNDGELTSSLTETCEVMNLEFQKVFIKSDKQPPTGLTALGENLNDITMTLEEVRNVLTGLKPTSAPGPDDVYPQMLKECANVVCQPLFEIFTRSLALGRVPQIWKRANVTPIYKKGPKSDPLNYRPVSLTSVVCKGMEKLIRTSLVLHLESTGYLTRHQHGFRSGKSCLTQLLEFFGDIEDTLDEGGCTDVIYLDCRKAFDTVPHGHLLKKLEAAGVGGTVKKWIQCFLEGREQRVVIRNSFSSWREVYSGVPQGSVLGPTLFLIYINDLLEDLRSQGKMFADDAKIYRKIRNDQDRDMLQEDLDRVTEWSEKWLLEFNQDKCRVMHIGRGNPGYTFALGGKTLQETEQEKDLGVLVRNDLKPSDHVCTITAAANSLLWRIQRTFTCLDEETLPALYKALVRPRLEFAVQAWSPSLKKDIAKLEKVQRRATKLIPSIASLPYEERLKKLDMPTLEDRRHRGDMIEVFKILKGIDKVQEGFLELDTNPRTRGNTLKLKKLRHRTQKRTMFFSSRVVNEWNKLPDWVIQSKTVMSFKKQFDKCIAGK